MQMGLIYLQRKTILKRNMNISWRPKLLAYFHKNVYIWYLLKYVPANIVWQYLLYCNCLYYLLVLNSVCFSCVFYRYWNTFSIILSVPLFVKTISLSLLFESSINITEKEEVLFLIWILYISIPSSFDNYYDSWLNTTPYRQFVGHFCM